MKEFVEIDKMPGWEIDHEENTVTMPKSYFENIIKVSVKVAKEKESKIIKDKLKKLIDEL